MAVLFPLFILSSMITYSNAAVCVCKDGNEEVLQKVIDYACGLGADCTQIQQTGACFQPNTVKNHCDIAVNSYYQKTASTGATCDFNGTAFIPTSPPSTASSCLSSSGSTGNSITGTPTTGNSTTGIPSTGNTTTGTPTNGMPTSPSSTFPDTTTMGPTGSIGLSVGEELSVGTKTVILLTTIAAVALRV